MTVSSDHFSGGSVTSGIALALGIQGHFTAYTKVTGTFCGI